MKQYAAIDDVVYFWFAGNDTSGSGGDGASPAADVRLAGAAAGAIPTYSPTPVLLTHANYPAGAYEIAITASAANGFAASNTYAVFCTLAIDSQNPTGFVGSFDTKPALATMTDWENGERLDLLLDATATASALATVDATADAILVDTGTTLEGKINTLVSDTEDIKGTGWMPTDSLQAIRDQGDSAWLTATGFNTTVPDAAGVAPTASEIKTEVEAAGSSLATILADTNELQTDWANGGRLDLILDIVAADTTTDIPTLIAALNDLSSAQANAACDTALSDYDPPTRTEATSDKDAIITEVNANETKIDTVDAVVDTILVDTNALQTDWVNGGRLDLLLDAIPTTAMRGTDSAALATALSTHDGKLDTVDTVVDAIRAKTDNLPSGIAKNVALGNFTVFMVLTSDHVTGATGKTVSATISKDGGAATSITSTVAEVGTGMYKLNSGLTQTEMNADVVDLVFSAADCDDRVITIHTT